jgi:hypothetical protein
MANEEQNFARTLLPVSESHITQRWRKLGRRTVGTDTPHRCELLEKKKKKVVKKKRETGAREAPVN